MAIVLLAVTAPRLEATDPFLRTVALTGQPAPGTSGATFAAFPTPPTFNELGQVAFTGMLQMTAPVTIDNHIGVWSEGSGALALLARMGNPAPGLPGVMFSGDFTDPVLNDLGQTAFRAGLRGAGVAPANDAAVWADLNGPLAIIAREGDTAGGVADGAVYDVLGSPALGNDQVAYSASLVGGLTLNSSGLWRSDGAAASLLAREGEQASGVAIASLAGRTPRIAPGGETAFWSAAIGGMNWAVWRNAGGMSELIASSGTQAPGAPAGVIFAGFGLPPTINVEGELAFAANLGGNGVNLGNDSGVWSGTSGGLALVAREGDPAPGAPEATFDSLAGPVSLNKLGQTAFFGKLLGSGITGRNNNGVWIQRETGLELFVREGASAPGLGNGVVFDFEPGPTKFALNEAGRIALITGLRDELGGFPSLLGVSIWAEDKQGVLRLIAREFDQLEVAPGDFRTVSTLLFLGDSEISGPSSGFNEAGQVAFAAQFTDGSWGVFVSDLATIPEPRTWALALSAALVPVARTLRTSQGLAAARRQRGY